MERITIFQPGYELLEAGEFPSGDRCQPAGDDNRTARQFQTFLNLFRRQIKQRISRSSPLKSKSPYEKSLHTALMTTLEALQAIGAGAGMLEQPSFRRNHGVSLEPPSSWSPTSGCPTIDVRLGRNDMAFVPTLSLIWSALPRKSRRASEALPVTSRQVRSRIGFGSSSMN